MFTEQIARATEALVAAGMPRNQADIIQSLLGDCVAALTHRGPVELAAPDPRVDGPEGDEVYYNTYALNIPEGSSINNWGDDVHHGDVWNIDNSVTNNNTTVTNNNVTENYDNSTVNYTNTNIIIVGGTITIDGDEYCWDELQVLEDVTTDKVAAVTTLNLAATVLIDADFDEDLCQLTFDDASQSYSTTDVVEDVNETHVTINVPTTCPP